MKFFIKLKELYLVSLFVVVSLTLSSCFDQKSSTDSMAIESQAEKYVIDTHYKKTKTVIENQSDKMEVNEFFWYGCPACQEFDPILKKWKSTLPDDVIIKQTPAIWNDVTYFHAKLFFIAKKLDNFETIHERLFKEAQAFRGEQDLSVQTKHFAKVFAEFGIEESDFINQLSSPEADEAKILVDSVGIVKIPTMMVNGEYYVITPSVKSSEEVLNVVDFLVEKERGKSAIKAHHKAE